jgi:hypothetical protein
MWISFSIDTRKNAPALRRGVVALDYLPGILYPVRLTRATAAQTREELWY